MSNDEPPPVQQPLSPGRLPRWYELRLWLVSLLCFASGLVTWAVLGLLKGDAPLDEAPGALQWYWFGAGLLVLLLWMAVTDSQQEFALGCCALGALLAIWIFLVLLRASQ
jgi:hypothetical protein